MSAQRPVLTVDELGYTSSTGHVLLRDVSFQMAQGTILAIAGPNGAGKTTLLNIMSGLQNATHGDVSINGQCLTQFSALERARYIAVVSQHTTADGRLRLRDYVALGQLPIFSDYSAEDHAIALEDLLVRTGLDKIADKPMGQISGGEKQRAHIARALVQKPKILFLDEPTNHLDPDAKGRILSLVTALDITVVMVIHDLVMIPEFATHIALIKDTRLMAYGLVHDVQTPQIIRETFGVDYHLFDDRKGRKIPALDIRKTHFLTPNLPIQGIIE